MSSRRCETPCMRALVWFLSRKFPKLMRSLIRRSAMNSLPVGYPVDVHFKPRYNPWDQRVCLDADGDLFGAISSGRVEVVTDHIDHVDATGIALKSGQHLDADIIVTATGLQLQALGWCIDQPRRRGDQAAGPVRLQGAHARRGPQPGVVRRLHQRVVDAARRHDRRAGVKAAVLHELSRLHTRLSASRQRADDREVLPGTSRPATCCAPRTHCPSRAPSGPGTSGRTTSPTPSTTASTASTSR